MISLLVSYGKWMIMYVNQRKKGCIIKEALGNKKKMDIDLTLFWGNPTIKYVV